MLGLFVDFITSHVQFLFGKEPRIRDYWAVMSCNDRELQRTMGFHGWTSQSHKTETHSLENIVKLSAAVTDFLGHCIFRTIMSEETVKFNKSHHILLVMSIVYSLA